MAHIDNIADLYTAFEECTCVTTDSRNISPGAMFFALRGASFDGNRFACAALDNGAAYAVVDSDLPASERPDLAERLLRVEDSLTALQHLAGEHRERLAMPIIAIVGSNGKTTTKELVKRVLAEQFEIYATHGNLNNHIGVPLTLLAMTRDTQFGIVEMGASSCGEIATLCNIARPNYGLITNIGRSHLEGFGGVEGIRRGKGELFDWLERNGGRAFVPQEDEVLMEMASERENMAVEYYSRSIADGYESHLFGKYNRANIAAAVEVGRYFDIDSERIATAIAGYTPDNNRSQEMMTERENRLIIDCYNANPSSMTAAIENVEETEHEHKMLILGDMLELGEWSMAEHCNILRLALSSSCKEILLVGENFGRALEQVDVDTEVELRHFATTDAAAEYLKEETPKWAMILLKASRGIALERLINLL